MHRLTIALALSIAVASAAYLAAVDGNLLALSLRLIPVLVALGVVITAAWYCRQSVGGSRLILVTLTVTAAIGWQLLQWLAAPLGIGSGTFIALYLGAVAYVVVLGCYLGYAFVEGQRLRPQNPGSDRGRFVVVCLLAVAIVVAISFAALAFS